MPKSSITENKIDILLVSGARPGLLANTLESFQQKLFNTLRIGTCFINIDPFEGGAEEVYACETICKKYFSNVVVRKPDQPNFTEAVRWLWSSADCDWALHLEDDWVLTRHVTRNEISAAVKPRVVQLPFMTAEKDWAFRSRFHYMVKKRKFLGIHIGKRLVRQRPIFTTGPSFIESSFARTCSELMRSDLDPEKQLYKYNEPLNRYTSQWRSHFIGSRHDIVAVDIGREHRAQQGIEKVSKDGNSVWVGGSGAG